MISKTYIFCLLFTIRSLHFAIFKQLSFVFRYSLSRLTILEVIFLYHSHRIVYNTRIRTEKNGKTQQKKISKRKTKEEEDIMRNITYRKQNSLLCNNSFSIVFHHLPNAYKNTYTRTYTWCGSQQFGYSNLVQFLEEEMFQMHKNEERKKWNERKWQKNGFYVTLEDLMCIQHSECYEFSLCVLQ